MRLSTLSLAAIALFSFTGNGAVGATIVHPTLTLVSNLNSSTETWDTIEHDPVATAFLVGDADVVVTGITLRAIFSSTSDRLLITIKANDGTGRLGVSAPGSILGSFVSYSTGTTVVEDRRFSATEPFALEANTQYWVDLNVS